MRLITSLLAAASFAAFAGPALAKEAAPAASVVVVDYQRVFAESLAGKDAQAKLKAIGDGIQKELDPDAKALQGEQAAISPKLQGKSNEQAAAALKADPALKSKYEAFVQHDQVFRQKAALRQQEFQVTERKAQSDVFKEADTDVAAAMSARGAAVAIERGNTIATSNSVDITTDVIERLNNRVKSINVIKADLTKQQQ